MADPFVQAHIIAMARLRQFAGLAIERAWRGLPGYDRENVDEWLSTVLPVVETAERASVALTDAYIAQILARRALGVDATQLLAGLRGGTAPSEVYKRPFVTVWTALGNGAEWEDAVATGLHRAMSTVEMDTQLAFRAAADEIGRQDDGIYGYQRVADGGACSFCLEVDGAYVKSADAMPLHNRCGCSLEPLPVPHVGAKFLPDGTQIRDSQYGEFINTPTPPGVAIHEHGELGAVLTDPAHDFTTASLALS